MGFVKDFIKWFIIINTGIFVILIPNTCMYDMIPSAIIWEVFAASAVTSLITAIFFAINPKKEIKVPVQIAIAFAHYAILLIVMIFLGNAFGWTDFSKRGILSMALSVTGVYICSAALSIVMGLKEAKKMNEALDEYR